MPDPGAVRPPRLANRQPAVAVRSNSIVLPHGRISARPCCAPPPANFDPCRLGPFLVTAAGGVQATTYADGGNQSNLLA